MKKVVMIIGMILVIVIGCSHNPVSHEEGPVIQKPCSSCHPNGIGIEENQENKR